MGNRYGKLAVQEFSHTDKKTSFWICICDCGNKTTTRGNTLRSGQCKSCGKCDVYAKPSVDAPQKRLWQSILTGAKSRNLSLEMTYEDFIVKSIDACFYCGMMPYDKHYAYSKRRKRGIDHDIFAVFNGLDRINSDEGYTIDNTVSCCIMCNRMKSDFKIGDFMNKVKEIYEHGKKAGKYS